MTRAVIVLLGCLAFAGADHVRRTTYWTSDELLHLGAARTLRFHEGEFLNFEHPVLMKLMASRFLAPQPPRPLVLEVRDGRRPFPFVFALLVVAAGLWAATTAGPFAGVAVAALLAIDPTFRAHGTIVQSDVLQACFLTIAAGLLAAAVRACRVSRPFLAASGVAYGFALVSKFSAAPFFLPFSLAAAASAALAAPAALPWRRRLLRGAGTAGVYVVLPALVTAYAIQAFAFSGIPDDLFRAAAERQFRDLHDASALPETLFALPRPIAAYALGLRYVTLEASNGARLNYFLGRVSGTGWKLYFPVVLFGKLTAAVVLALLATLAAIVVTLGRASPLRRRRLVSLFASRSALGATLAAAYLTMASLSNLNIGARHGLSIVPFTLVAAAGAAATLLRRRKRLLGALAATLVAVSALEAAARFDREIPFGNILVGGPRGMRRIASDSNVEWGERQNVLFDRVKKGDLGRVCVVTLVLDEEEAVHAGIVERVDRGDSPNIDTAIVSVHLWDLAHALAMSHESFPRATWATTWLTPVVLGLEKRATSVEPLGDSYLILRLRPSRTSARAVGPRAPFAKRHPAIRDHPSTTPEVRA